ncbi:hypothetical protein TNCV_4825501 [Trichonephila clavipes]|uniref:Uncharacterized protein n=1 Tax=Trichonephila clavipes TaxID=2585209 RepID=A0A8X6RS80_TRICX|nr:hypothetical protein TNCV_4825501 [Trichonephila clavipes]
MRNTLDSQYRIEDCFTVQMPQKKRLSNVYSESIAIIGIMQKKNDLSEVQKGMIMGFRTKGGSLCEMAKCVSCSRVDVEKVYHAWQNWTARNQRRVHYRH